MKKLSISQRENPFLLPFGGPNSWKEYLFTELPEVGELPEKAQSPKYKTQTVINHGWGFPLEVRETDEQSHM